MVNINQQKYNNSYTTVSSTLDNPYVASSIDYGDFSSADPVLNTMLPKVLNLGYDHGNADNMKDVFNNYKNINYGLTSPGTIDNAMSCTGLDFINTNPNVDKLTFQMCLNKFTKQYNIPEQVFNNLMHSLPYTFSTLSTSEKNRYIKLLKNFITENEINDKNDENTEDNNSTKHQNNEQENFENIKENFNGSNCSGSSGLSISGILTIVLIIIIILVFILFIANKK